MKSLNCSCKWIFGQIHHVIDELASYKDEHGAHSVPSSQHKGDQTWALFTIGVRNSTINKSGPVHFEMLKGQYQSRLLIILHKWTFNFTPQTQFSSRCLSPCNDPKDLKLCPAFAVAWQIQWKVGTCRAKESEALEPFRTTPSWCMAVVDWCAQHQCGQTHV